MKCHEQTSGARKMRLTYGTLKQTRFDVKKAKDHKCFFLQGMLFSDTITSLANLI